jgi:predicted RNA-binding Zn ribbon-like protein
MRTVVMDKATWDRFGEDFAPGGRAPAPGSLRLIQRFLNTHNHEFPAAWDRLGSPQGAAVWLRKRGLLREGEDLSQPELDRLLRLRDSLRALVGANGGSRLTSPALAALNEAGRTCLRMEFGLDGRPTLEPAAGGVEGAIGHILAAGYRAWLQGSWPRLKGCAECGWAFYDRSRNRSARWCSMKICGNRTKNRVYRRRRGATPTGIRQEGDAP